MCVPHCMPFWHLSGSQTHCLHQCTRISSTCSKERLNCWLWRRETERGRILVLRYMSKVSISNSCMGHVGHSCSVPRPWVLMTRSTRLRGSVSRLPGSRLKTCGSQECGKSLWLNMVSWKTAAGPTVAPWYITLRRRCEGHPSESVPDLLAFE